MIFRVPSVTLKAGKGSLMSGKRRALLLRHEVQRRPRCFLNSLSESRCGWIYS